MRALLYECKGAHTLFIGQSEREKEREGERERKRDTERVREREREREGEGDVEYVHNCYFYNFIFKRNEWCLGTF